MLDLQNVRLAEKVSLVPVSPFNPLKKCSIFSRPDNGQPCDCCLHAIFRGLLNNFRRTLVTSIIHTSKALVWALVLLLLIEYVFAVLFTQDREPRKSAFLLFIRSVVHFVNHCLLGCCCSFC